jgi:predicted phage terminase large subunit-like protein
MVQIHAVPVPAVFDTMIQSWDMAFKDNASSDFVVGQIWGARGADRFLLDQHRARLNMPGTKAAVRSLSDQWPKATAKLVEDKANGPAVIQELQHQIEGLIGITPEGGKVARAHAVSAIVESGNVYLPHPKIHSWVEAFMEETAAFRNGRHDDQVDAMTQALNRLRRGGGMFSIPESQITIDPFPIPDEWPRAFGLAIQPSGVGALWGARDPNGVIYVYAEHHVLHAEPSQNACAIRRLGKWIPGVLSAASTQGSQTMRHAVAQLYRDHGLEIFTSRQGDETAQYQLSQSLATKRIRVFTSLEGFLNAYRIGDDEAALVRACAALIAGDEYMQTKPTPKERTDGYYPIFGGQDGWMAA